MKKTIFLYTIMVVVIFAGCHTASNVNNDVTKPVFDSPNSVVFDAWSYGRKYHDLVKVYSSMAQEQITFNVFGYDAINKTWEIIGTAKLKKVSDVDTIRSSWNEKLNKFRWFAVQSLDGLNFRVGVVIDRNDVRITVYD